MKEATYKILGSYFCFGAGAEITIMYDETAPCRMCGLPVGAASMGGTDVCPSCDCGVNRDGSPRVYPANDAFVSFALERMWATLNSESSSSFYEMCRRISWRNENGWDKPVITPFIPTRIDSDPNLALNERPIIGFSKFPGKDE